MTARRVTPTAALVLRADASREAWLAERRHGIGSSDLAAILGLSKYGNAMTVWADKLGLVDDEDPSEAAEWGIDLEDVVARAWADRVRMRVARLGLVAHIGQPWRRCSLDRKVFGCDRGPCALEVKTRSAWKADEWANGAVPESVEAQVQWQLAVTGLDHIHLAVLIGGQQLVDRVVDEDLSVQSFLVSEAERVWECVQAEIAPHVEPDGLLVGLYQRMYPDREGAVELGPDAKRYLEDYRFAAALGKDAAADKENAKAGLLGLLGSAEVGLIGGVPVFTYRTSKPSPVVDVAVLQRDHPDAYAACVTTPAAGSRRFTLSKERTS
jgi:putative phage-type endonuclease